MSAAATAATSSAKAEQGFPISAARMMGLETAAAILGGVEQVAAALALTPRMVRYKMTGDRGISDADLNAVAGALDERAQRISTHAGKLRAEAAMAASASGKLRPPYGRTSSDGYLIGRRRNLEKYIAAGGSASDYARIHKVPLATLRRLLASEPR